jgi:hypothetical protein
MSDSSKLKGTEAYIEEHCRLCHLVPEDVEEEPARGHDGKVGSRITHEKIKAR